MSEYEVGCLLVCEAERLVGVFTERDLMRRVLAVGLPLTTPVAACMTPDPVVVDEKESIRPPCAAWKRAVIATCR